MNVLPFPRALGPATTAGLAKLARGGPEMRCREATVGGGEAANMAAASTMTWAVAARLGQSEPSGTKISDTAANQGDDFFCRANVSSNVRAKQR